MKHPKATPEFTSGVALRVVGIADDQIYAKPDKPVEEMTDE